MLCIGIFGGALLVRLLLCNASLVHCFLVLGAIYFWCCVFCAMHCQLHHTVLLPQWHIYFIRDQDKNSIKLLTMLIMQRPWMKIVGHGHGFLKTSGKFCTLNVKSSITFQTTWNHSRPPFPPRVSLKSLRTPGRGGWTGLAAKTFTGPS